jgi:hypothetical protein
MKRITRLCADKLKRMKSKTDWKRFDALTEADIAQAGADDSDAPLTTPADWTDARVIWPVGKENRLHCVSTKTCWRGSAAMEEATRRALTASSGPLWKPRSIIGADDLDRESRLPNKPSSRRSA